jgi:hypothetical protein
MATSKTSLSNSPFKKNTSTRMLLILAALLLWATAPHATAAVLTFDIVGQADYAPLSQEYGDRITSTAMGSFSYGIDSGYTPNISVTYTGTPGGPLGSDLCVWGSWSTQETNVLNNEDDGEPLLRIDFTADSGYLVNLHSFDLTAYLGGTFTVDNLLIQNQNGALLSESGISINGPINYNDDDEGTIWSGTQISIILDLTSVGRENDSIGLDNIKFSQSVPEPATMSLLAVGAMALLKRRRQLRLENPIARPETNMDF